MASVKEEPKEPSVKTEEKPAPVKQEKKEEKPAAVKREKKEEKPKPSLAERVRQKATKISDKSRSFKKEKTKATKEEKKKGRVKTEKPATKAEAAPTPAPAPRHTLVGNVTKIVAAAAGSVIATKIAQGFVLSSQTEFKCELQGGELRLEPRMTSFGGGSSVVLGPGGMVSNFTGSGLSFSNGYMSIGNVVSGRMFVNGQEVDLNSLRNVRQSEQKADPRYSKRWEIHTKSEIRLVIANGTCTLQFASDLLSSSPTLNVGGTGGIILSLGKSYDVVSASISGMGRIHLGENNVRNLTALVSGMGGIDGFRITHTGVLNVSGMGNISGRATRDADFHENRSGMGGIRVSRERG